VTFAASNLPFTIAAKQLQIGMVIVEISIALSHNWLKTRVSFVKLQQYIASLLCLICRFFVCFCYFGHAVTNKKPSSTDLQNHSMSMIFIYNLEGIYNFMFYVKMPYLAPFGHNTSVTHRWTGTTTSTTCATDALQHSCSASKLKLTITVVNIDKYIMVLKSLCTEHCQQLLLFHVPLFTVRNYWH